MAFHNLLIRSFTRAEDPALYQKAQKVRTEVFVEEQQVPQAHEIDAVDEVARHYVVLDPIDPLPLATARLYRDPDQHEVMRLGRMAVRKPYRGQGIGKLLVREMLDEVKNQGFTEVVCNAQTHALEFYKSQGFEPHGQEFMEEGIPHFAMRCLLAGSRT